MRVAAAAALYFAIVFCVGFVLGPIRVLWLEPSLGKTAAVLCEAPLLLIAMILAARWVPARVGLRTDFSRLAMMGIGALGLQQIADFAVGVFLRGLSPDAVSLVSFAVMPLLVNGNWAKR